MADDSIRVIAIDPGVTSGFCYGIIIPHEGLTFFPTQFIDDVDDLHGRLSAYQPRYIVMENFEFRQGKQRTGVNLFPVQLIGIARYYEMTCSHQCALQLQSAAQGKSYYKDDLLKKLNFYKRGVPHGMDATRHLLQWITFGSGYQYSEGKQIGEFAKQAVSYEDLDI